MSTFKSDARDAAEKYADIKWDRLCGSYPNPEWMRDGLAFKAGAEFGAKRMIEELRRLESVPALKSRLHDRACIEACIIELERILEREE